MTQVSMLANPHYLAAAEFLGGRTAARSGVPYLSHVLEGVRILEKLNASLRAKEAFCLHPIVQGDEDLTTSVSEGSVLHRWSLDSIAVTLSMEYRSVANRYLSRMPLRAPEMIELSPIDEVNKMLIADKVQNRKDFEKYNPDHPRAEHLSLYFESWLSALEVSEAQYQELIGTLDDQPQDPA